MKELEGTSNENLVPIVNSLNKAVGDNEEARQVTTRVAADLSDNSLSITKSEASITTRTDEATTVGRGSSQNIWWVKGSQIVYYELSVQ